MAGRLLERVLPVRVMENGISRSMQNMSERSLQGSSSVSGVSSQVSVVYPKTAYNWTDRTGIKAPDVVGTISTSSLTISNAGNAGTLVITADGTAPSASIGIAVVTWDERGNAIGVVSASINTSGWLKNSSGHYIAANGGTSYTPGFFPIDVSLAAGYTVLVQSIQGGATVNLHWKLF